MAKGKDWNDLHRERPGSIRELADDPTNDISFEPEKTMTNGDASKQKTEAPGTQEPPRIVLRAFNPADWEGKKAPPRKSIVPDYIPDETVTLLYADGGTGKSYLKLQLAVARALAKEWIGLLPVSGRTLVLSTEDDLDEMWRRIEGMIEAETGPFAGARMADLGNIRLVDLVGENSILGLLTKGIIEPTPMYAALESRFQKVTRPGSICGNAAMKANSPQPLAISSRTANTCPP
jgi:hypothetical protein